MRSTGLWDEETTGGPKVATTIISSEKSVGVEWKETDKLISSVDVLKTAVLNAEDSWAGRELNEQQLADSNDATG